MKNIYFFIGTKAQAIKCLPVIQEFEKQNKHRLFLIDSGQHVEIVDYILKNLSNSIEKINVFKNKKNITTINQTFFWFGAFIWNYLIKRSKQLSSIHPGLCIIHGDTLSTLLGLLWSKKYKMVTVHLESGLSSKKLLKPFPEEIVRRIVSKYSDILICFDESAHNNLLQNYNSSNKTIKRISENTILDSVKLVPDSEGENKITVTLHRTENLMSKKTMEKFISLLEILSTKFIVNWHMHGPTINYIKKHKLTIPSEINIGELLTHEKFLHEVASSAIVITDGGSVQEECYFLGKKTLIWRKETEREYALADNMLISNFDLDLSLDFIYKEHKIAKNNYFINVQPSAEIVNFLNNYP